ncbi:MAG TPA: hypothetical protein VGN59_15720 [Acidimicrobiia bacterium]|jgi:hypothetical protein
MAPAPGNADVVAAIYAATAGADLDAVLADRVVQRGRTAGTVRASGSTFDVAEVHVWTLRDGRVVAAELFIDTPAMLAALQA